MIIKGDVPRVSYRSRQKNTIEQNDAPKYPTNVTGDLVEKGLGVIPERISLLSNTILQVKRSKYMQGL